MFNSNRLFALVDRAQLLLNIPVGRDEQSITSLLETLGKGVEQLESEQKRLEDSEAPDKTLRDREDILIRLRRSYDDLISQYEAGSKAEDDPSSSRLRSLPTTSHDGSIGSGPVEGLGCGSSFSRKSKSVRFSDAPHREEEDAADNNRLLNIHSQIIEEQDGHLETLSDSISRQRLLSIQIGDELESQAELLDSVDDLVDRTNARLSSARKRLNFVAKNAKDNGSLITIAVLIVVLIILIVVLK